MAWIVALALVAGPAAAVQRVAILPAEASGGTSKEILRTVNDTVVGLVQSAIGVEAVVGVAIKKKVRADARACAEQPPCLAKIGRRLKVDEVVTVRARTHGNGLRLTFLAIGVEDRRLRRTVSVNVDTVDDLAGAVRIHLAKILGVTQKELFAASAAEDEIPLEPMPSLAPLPGAGEMAEMAPPDDDGEPAGDEPVETAAAQPVEDAIAAVEPTPGPMPAPVRHRAEPSPWMWYSGLGALGVAAVLGGVSTAFGVRYLSKKNAIEDDTPQVRAQELRDQANSSGKVTNITAAVAGVLAAAGAGLVVADLVADEDVSVRVSVEADGGRASLILLW